MCVALVALSLTGCNTSYNYFQDEVETSEQRDTSLFGTMLTVTGVIPPQRQGLDPSPRAPIAIPKSTDLPEPGSGTAAEAAVNFPEDHDAAEARKRAAIRSTLAGPNYVDDGVRKSPNTRLSLETMQDGRRAGGGLRNRGAEINANPFGSKTSHVSRRELQTVVRSEGRGREVLMDDGTPAPRQYLIQPPTAYRTPADTAPLPEKKDIKNSDWVKDRLYDVKDRTPRRLQE